MHKYYTRNMYNTILDDRWFTHKNNSKNGFIRFSDNFKFMSHH